MCQDVEDLALTHDASPAKQVLSKVLQSSGPKEVALPVPCGSDTKWLHYMFINALHTERESYARRGMSCSPA